MTRPRRYLYLALAASPMIAVVLVSIYFAISAIRLDHEKAIHAEMQRDADHITAWSENDDVVDGTSGKWHFLFLKPSSGRRSDIVGVLLDGRCNDRGNDGPVCVLGSLDDAKLSCSRLAELEALYAMDEAVKGMLSTRCED